MATASPPTNSPSTERSPASVPSSTAKPTDTKKRSGWGIAARILSILVSAIALLLVLALGGLWIWAGTNGSLRQALELAQRFVPLEVKGVTGAIRGGGKIDHLTYKQDGLSAEVNNAELAWEPSALLDKTLKIKRLSAGSIKVLDKRAPTPSEPPTGPPESIKLPIKIEVDKFAVDRFEWAGPPPVAVTDIAGSYAYNGEQHKLTVDSTEVMNGRYSAKATIADTAPIKLDAELSGQLKTDVPGGGAEGVGVSFNASAIGPLTDLAVKATAETTAAAAQGSGPTRAEVTAQVTPWAAQPVPKADAKFSDFDAGALWSTAPHTQLTGEAHVKPTAASAGAPAEDKGGWHLKADIGNAIPGPYDKKRLPLERLQAEGDWHDGVALIEQLEAKLGGGTLRASGKWAGAPATPKPGDPTATQPEAGAAATAPAEGWKVEATLDRINPAALHTQMAALPIDGKATASGAGEAISFDVALRPSAGGAGGSASTASASAQQLTEDLRRLQLRNVNAIGRWSDGRLSLSKLELRTEDATLTGALDVRPAGPGGQGQLQFDAPGLDLKADGELRENSGAGVAKIAVADVAKLLRWVKALPGVPDSVKQTNASGRATLTARWKGGWRDPALDVKLDVPKLDYVPPPSAEGSTQTAKAGAKSAGSAADQTIRLRDFDASIVGKLSQADIKVDGRAEMGQRKAKVDLAARVGRVSSDKPLGASAWQGTVRKVDAQVTDPAIGKGPWSLSVKNDVPFKWSPTPGTGSFEAGAGKAVLAAPPTKGGAASQANIEWEPVSWRSGQLRTKGQLKGLPLAWAELASGGPLAGGRVSGDMVFNGDWDVTLGDKLDVKASLYRASGDLNIVTSPGAGSDATVPAGVKDVRVSVQSSGNDLNLDLTWDTAKAGQVKGRISTKLTKAGPDGGWTLAKDAPLQGNLKVKLPKLGVWSQLAPPGWRIEGDIATDVKMAGTLTDPKLDGTITADDLTLRSIVDGFEFTDGKLRAELDGQRLVIDEFTLYGAGGKGKGGSITAKGSAELVAGKPQAKLNANIDHLRPSLRTDAEITLSGDIDASLADSKALVTGALKVDRARIELPEDSAPSLGSDVVVRRGKEVASGEGAAAATAKPEAARAKSAAAAKKEPAEPQVVKLDVKIDMGNDFKVSGLGITSGITGELAVAGDSLTDPRVTGTIRTEDGKYRAYGQRLNVDHGIIRFTGKPTNPTLDVLAKRANMEFADVQVGVEITGTALLPRVRLWSEPDLADNEKLSWLVLGRASASSGAEAALLQTAALAFVSGKDSGGGIAEKVGLDELSLGEAKGAGGGSTGAAAVTLGKRFSKNFYAAYERSLSGAVGTLFLFYDLTKRVTLRGATGERSALDLIYTLKYD
ncbi:MAG: translocation/assembly module TamB domain-containing protein [Burkholderiales bacterium]